MEGQTQRRRSTSTWSRSLRPSGPDRVAVHSLAPDRTLGNGRGAQVPIRTGIVKILRQGRVPIRTNGYQKGRIARCQSGQESTMVERKMKFRLGDFQEVVRSSSVGCALHARSAILKFSTFFKRFWADFLEIRTKMTQNLA